MAKHTFWKKLVLFVLTLLLVLAAPDVRVASQTSDNAFNRDVKHILAHLSKGDLRSFASISSREGVTVVRRTIDWKRSSPSGKGGLGPFKDPYLPDNGGDLPLLRLDGQEAMVVDEIRVDFPAYKLKKAKFQKILKLFRLYLRNSQKYYQGPDWSTTVWDDQYCRYLGTAIWGTLASNVTWYIQLTQEKGTWKVRTLECVAR